MKSSFFADAVRLAVAVAASIVFTCGAADASADSSLERTFENPPDSARPWVYWYFMDGNTTREGMKADLDAM